MKNVWSGVVAMLLMVSINAVAEGGVSFSRNRIIFKGTDKAVTLSVINRGRNPWLIQSNVFAEPDTKSAAPFMVTPPLFRLEGNAENTFRIVRAGGEFPQDRESVFYFSANAIPSQSSPSSEAGQQPSGRLSISVRTVLKLFWRPEGLDMAADKAPSAMRFIRTPGGITIENPTPYYQSLALLSLDGRVQDIDRVPSMVPPFGELHFSSAIPVSRVTWSVMNDYGGATKPVDTRVENTAGLDGTRAMKF